MFHIITHEDICQTVPLPQRHSNTPLPFSVLEQHCTTMEQFILISCDRYFHGGSIMLCALYNCIFTPNHIFFMLYWLRRSTRRMSLTLPKCLIFITTLYTEDMELVIKTTSKCWFTSSFVYQPRHFIFPQRRRRGLTCHSPPNLTERLRNIHPTHNLSEQQTTAVF